MKFPSSAVAFAGAVLSLAEAPAADPPEWWADYGVTDGAAPNHRGPANLGQLKWMARCAWFEMERQLPGGAGFALEFVVPPVPASPDAAWHETQRKVANLGQLKHVAHPFYERLLLVAPDWMAAEYGRNGLVAWPHPMPWDPATPAGQNLAPANIGQLKLVFSLRFGESHDGDTIPDLLEHVFYGNTDGDGTATDSDGDGFTDAEEVAAGTKLDDIDSDHDGLLDGEDANPISFDAAPQTPVTAIVVPTPLE